MSEKCRAPAQQSRTMQDRRRKPQQMDLFASGESSAVIGAPGWPALPLEVRRLLISLMARLILEHADKRQVGAEVEAGHDI
jgi:hypothetical protein